MKIYRKIALLLTTTLMMTTVFMMPVSTFASSNGGVQTLSGSERSMPSASLNLSLVLGYKCRANGVGYNTLSDAIASVKTDTPTTIKMTEDITESITINNGQNITLDLNGYVLTAESSNRVIVNGGNLTIIDSDPTVTHSFSKVTDGTYEGLLKQDDKGSDVLSGGCITGGYSNTGGGIWNGGTLSVEGGNIVGNVAEYIGAGVLNRGKASFKNCAILGNVQAQYSGYSSKSGGAGIGNDMSGTLTLGDGTKITDNISHTIFPSGGVYNYGSVLNYYPIVVSGTVTITNNTTVNGDTVMANLCLRNASTLAEDRQCINPVSFNRNSNIGITTMNNNMIGGYIFCINCFTRDFKAFSSDNSSYVTAYDDDESRAMLVESDWNNSSDDFVVHGIAAKKSITYTWSKVSGASKYKVYFSRSGSKYTCKKVKTTTKTSYKKTGLKSGRRYKARIVAYNKKGKKIAKSSLIYITTNR